MEIIKLIVGPLNTNCYLLKHKVSGSGFVIDPGAEATIIKNRIRSLKINIKACILTHAHADHFLAYPDLNFPLWMHSRDEKLLKDFEGDFFYTSGISEAFNTHISHLQDLSIIKLDDIILKVIHTPGHTPGSICILTEEILFTGDTLFSNGFGRADFPYSNKNDLLRSIKKLFKLDDKIKIYPGHGDSSTIGDEKKNLGSFLINVVKFL